MTAPEISQRVAAGPDYVRAIAKAKAEAAAREMPGNPFPRHSPWWEKLNAAYRAANAQRDRESRHVD